MRAYGKVETAIWQNPKFRGLSERGRQLALYMFSCPHGNSVGCFVLPVGYICADMQWPDELVSEHVAELVSKRFIDRDERTCLTRVRGWWGHNSIENVNVAKSALKAMRMLPRCVVFYAALQALNQIDNKFINSLENEFADVFANEFANPEPEPNLTEPEPKQSGAPVPAGPADGSGELPLITPSTQSARVVQLPVKTKKARGYQEHPAFEEFWRTCIKRQGGRNNRKAAADQFSRAVKRGEDPQAIISGAAAYAEKLRCDGKLDYAREPQNWLRDEDWKSQPSPSEPQKPWSPFGTGTIKPMAGKAGG